MTLGLAASEYSWLKREEGREKRLERGSGRGKERPDLFPEKLVAEFAFKRKGVQSCPKQAPGEFSTLRLPSPVPRWLPQISLSGPRRPFGNSGGSGASAWPELKAEALK